MISSVHEQNVRVHSSKSDNFRTDIQGLRAVAVGAVVLNHANVPGFSGGYTGVDVFFVISGFLITGLLLGDLDKFSKIHFLNFYARRAARILPAAGLTIAFTAIASVAVLGILQARTVLVDSVWSVFFAANNHFAEVGTNYFSPTDTSPLQHFWSLAVEEQFYLVWPALLGLIAMVSGIKRRAVTPRVAISVSLFLIFAGSLYLSITQTTSNPVSSYFSTLDRVWELALGAILAIVAPCFSKISEQLRRNISWGGVITISMGILFFKSTTAFPGFNALVPVLGSAAVLAGGVGSPTGGAHKILSLKPVKFIGDVSYSLYLVHFPIFILGAVHFGQHEKLSIRLGLVIASLIAASMSYFLIENPVRHFNMFKLHPSRALFLWPLAVSLVVAIAIFDAPTTSFVGSSSTAKFISAPLAVDQAVANAEAGDPIPNATNPSLMNARKAHVNLGNCSAFLHLTSKICNFGSSNGTKTIVLFGNSHSVMWIPAIAVAAKTNNWKFFPVVKQACGYDTYTDVVPGLSPKNDCTTFYTWAKKQIVLLHPDAIIMGSYTGTKYWQQGETVAINQLKAITPRFTLLSDTPAIPEPAACLLKTGATLKTCLAHETTNRVSAQKLTMMVAKNANVEYLDVTPWFCNKGLCPSLINDIIPYYDGAHLTRQYSKFLGNDMKIALNLNGVKVIQPAESQINH